MIGHFYPALVYNLAAFAFTVDYNTVVIPPAATATAEAANDLIWLETVG